MPEHHRRPWIGNDFKLLSNNVGMHQFVFQDMYTYCRLTLKFLSTMTHTIGHYAGQEERIHFYLMNNNHDLTLNEWCAIFGFINNDGHLCYCHDMLTL